MIGDGILQKGFHRLFDCFIMDGKINRLLRDWGIWDDTEIG